MADWKLEQVNVEHSRIDTLAEGDKGDGLVWVLTHPILQHGMLMLQQYFMA